MTKLLEWIAVFSVLGVIWLSLVNKKHELTFAKQYETLILISPLIFMGLFGGFLSSNLVTSDKSLKDNLKKMTKLLEWIAVFSVLGAIWLSLVNNKHELTFAKQYETLILISPLIFIGLFGLYAITVVLYRVFTFNDCEKAAAELQEEIQEARTELSKLGFQFREDTKKLN